METLEKFLLVKEMITQLVADPRANQQINFTANLDRAGNTRIYFIPEEAKETKLGFSQGIVKYCQYVIE